MPPENTQAEDTQPEGVQQSPPISVLGAGSWGTALALRLADNGHNVTLWGRDEVLLEEIAQTRCNHVYLPNGELPRNVRLQSNLADAVNSACILVLAVPSSSVRTVAEVIAPELCTRQEGLISAAKGIEAASAKLIHQVLRETLGTEISLACLSGPSFAEEVAARLPTAIAISSEDKQFADKAAALFHSPLFRVYTNNDLIGTEIAGAFKNIIAIAIGISDGLGFGANARAALITRGLSEIRRLAEAMGAKSATLNGLVGIGDLVLTCTSDKSRNRRLGLLLAEGYSSEEAGKKVNQATEGVPTAEAAQRLAQHYGVEMPICEQVNKVIAGKIKPQQAVQELLERPSKPED